MHILIEFIVIQNKPKLILFLNLRIIGKIEE